MASSNRVLIELVAPGRVQLGFALSKREVPACNEEENCLDAESKVNQTMKRNVVLSSKSGQTVQLDHLRKDGMELS